MAAKKIANPVVAIVGATGAVGVELLQCLEQRKFPLKELKLFASARSAGKTMKFRGKDVAVQELTDASFAGVDIGLFSAGSGTTKKFAQAAVKAGTTFLLPGPAPSITSTARRRSTASLLDCKVLNQTDSFLPPLTGSSPWSRTGPTSTSSSPPPSTADPGRQRREAGRSAGAPRAERNGGC